MFSEPVGLIEIEGPVETLRNLDDVVGLLLVDSTATELENGRWTITAYATDVAVSEVQARGATVTVEMTSAEFTAYMDQVRLETDSDGQGEV